MPRMGDDHAESLAEQSVNTSVVPPTKGNPDHQNRSDFSTGRRSLTGNDQRKRLDRTDPDSPQADNRVKPWEFVNGPVSPHETDLERRRVPEEGSESGKEQPARRG